MNTEIRDISLKEIETFVSLWPSFENFVDYIVDYIPDILFPTGFWVGYSSYEINCDRLEITIKDSYHSDTCCFSIPLDDIINNTWKEYIDDLEKKAIEQQKKTEEKLREEKEKKELEEYERLKEKFENHG